VRELEDYLVRGDHRLTPEVILSARMNVSDEANEAAGLKLWVSAKGDRASLTIDSTLQPSLEMHIRRIDGNHRLTAAAGLPTDELALTKYLAPFSILVMGPVGDVADDYAEALIFHSINSNALPIESQHGLQLLLGQSAAVTMPPEAEYAYNRVLYGARVVWNSLCSLLTEAQLAERFGENALSRIAVAVKLGLLPSTQSRFDFDAVCKSFAASALDASATLGASGRHLLFSESFFAILAVVCSKDEAWNSASVSGYLAELASWIAPDMAHLMLSEPLSAAAVVAAYDVHVAERSKKVFLARWYPDPITNPDAYRRAQLRLAEIERIVADLCQQYGLVIELVDLGSAVGSTFGIHDRMYSEIEASDAIICDLTGGRPNVFVEAGFALGHHPHTKLLFVVENEAHERVVPFDLSTFKYVQIEQAAELTTELRRHLIAVMDLE